MLKLKPDTVTMFVPRALTFVMLLVLTEGESNDKTSVTLPIRLPAVSETLRVPERIDVKRQCTVVSDSHAVNSLAVLPNRVATV